VPIRSPGAPAREAANPSDAPRRPQGLPDGHLWFRDIEEAAAAQAEVVKALSAGGFTPFATTLAGDAAAAVVWSRRPNDGADVPDAAVGDISADLSVADVDGAPVAAVSVLSLDELPPRERAAVESAYRRFMSSVAPPRQAAQVAGRPDKKQSRRLRQRRKASLYVRDLLCFVDGDALQHCDSLEKLQDAFRDAMRWHLGRALSARSCAELGLDEELAQLAGSFLFAGPLTEVLSHAERLQDVGSRYLGDMSDEEEEQKGDDDGDSEDEDDAAEREELLRMEREDFNDDGASLGAGEKDEDEEEEDDADEDELSSARSILAGAGQEEVDLSGFYPETVAVLARLTFMKKRHADADSLVEAAMAGGFRPQVTNFMSRRESQHRRRDGTPHAECFNVRPTLAKLLAVKDALRRGREQVASEAEHKSKNARSA